MPPKGDYLLNVRLCSKHLIYKVETNKMKNQNQKTGWKKKKKEKWEGRKSSYFSTQEATPPYVTIIWSHLLT